jgi:hypothetical protein
MTTNFFSHSLLLLFLDPGSGMGKNQDPEKYPGSATLLTTVPDDPRQTPVTLRPSRLSLRM